MKASPAQKPKKKSPNAEKIESLLREIRSPTLNDASRVHYLLLLAGYFFDDGQYREAEKAYGILIQINSNKSNYHGRLARTLFELGRYAEALDEYNLARRIALETDDRRDYCELSDYRAIAQYQLGLYNPMIEDLNEGSKLFPIESQVWLDLGMAYLRLNNFYAALENFQKVHDTFPNYRTDAQQKIAQTQKAKEAYEKAQKEAQKRAAKLQKQKKPEASKTSGPSVVSTQDLFARTGERNHSDIQLLTMGSTMATHDFCFATPTPAKQPLDLATVDVDLLRPLKSTIHSFDIFFQGQFIGEGAVGVVHLAKWGEKTVAIKTAKNPADNLHLRNEGYVLTELKHPFIIEFHGACIAQESVWLAFENCDHGSLSQYIYETGVERFHISLACKLRWTQQAACGLDYLHSQNILHRDLKPENILLTGSEWTARICDFSIGAKMLSPEAAHVDGEPAELPVGHNLMPPQRKLQGTLPYIAPELFYAYFHGQEIPFLPYCSRTDMYSFGMLLYCIFMGQVPYPELAQTPQDPEQVEIFGKNILANKRPTLDSSKILPSIAGFIHGFWHPDPFARPSAKSAQEELQKIQKTEKFSKEEKAKLPIMKK